VPGKRLASDFRDALVVAHLDDAGCQVDLAFLDGIHRVDPGIPLIVRQKRGPGNDGSRFPLGFVDAVAVTLKDDLRPGVGIDDAGNVRLNGAVFA
jgi:hypothetical protein